MCVSLEFFILYNVLIKEKFYFLFVSSENDIDDRFDF